MTKPITSFKWREMAVCWLHGYYESYGGCPKCIEIREIAKAKEIAEHSAMYEVIDE